MTSVIERIETQQPRLSKTAQEANYLLPTIYSRNKAGGLNPTPCFKG